MTEPKHDWDIWKARELISGWGRAGLDLNKLGDTFAMQREIADELREAERKGAEWMRERAAKACDKEGFARVGWDAKALVASRIIRALPLPGDTEK